MPAVGTSDTPVPQATPPWPSPEPSAAPAPRADPTQQRGSDASRSGGLLEKDHDGNPLPALTPLPGGGQATQSATGGAVPPAPPTPTP